MNAVIMALDKRIGLANELEQQCLDKGWNVKKFISGDGSNQDLEYDHIDPIITSHPEEWVWGEGIQAKHHYLAFLTHKKIIKYAIKMGWDKFLLLEDDAYLLDRFDDCYKQIEDTVDSNNYDLLYLGWWKYEMENHLHAGENVRIEDEYRESGKADVIINYENIGGFHGVIINSTMYDRLFSLPAVAPMDSQCNGMVGMFRMLTRPKLIHVRTCFSICEQIVIKRDII